jgi:MFS family permease
MNQVPLVTLIAAVLISGFGSFISSIALPWLVLQYNHSPTDAGITAFFATIPIILNGAFGGAVVDAFGSKKTSIVSDILAGITISMIPFLALLDSLSFTSILFVAFFAKLFESPGATARLSMIVGVAEAADWSLAKANATLSAAARSAGLLGPAAAGAIVALIRFPSD